MKNMASNPAPLVFISYSHADDRWLKLLLKKLTPVLRRAPTAFWCDDKIKPGQQWREVIDQALASAKVALLLVSDNFLASDFIVEEELPFLLNAANEGRVKLLAVLINACLYDETELKGFQFLHPVSEPLYKLKGARRDEAILSICQAIRSEIDTAPPTPPAPQPSSPSRLADPLHTLKPPIADFVERAELAELLAMLAGRRLINVTVHGTRGVGKTEMARRLAVELKDRFPDAQIEIDLRGASPNPLMPQQVMEQVIRAFHPETAQLPEELADLRAIYLQVLDGQRALLLLDNARDKAQVEPLVPPPSCGVLITSRQHFTLPRMQHADLGRLAPEDARKLALEIAGRRAGSPAQVDELLEACDRLALALRIAATTLAENTTFTVEEHLERLRANRLKHLEPVAAALQSSYDLLPPELQRAWPLLGVFPTDFDPEAAAAVLAVAQPSSAAGSGGVPPPERTPGGTPGEPAGATPALPDARDAMQSLVNASLVEWNEEKGRFRLHDLARDFALAQLRSGELAFAGNLAPGSNVSGGGQPGMDNGGARQSAATPEHSARLRHAAHYTKVAKRAKQLYKTKGKVLEGLALFDRERQHIEAAFEFLLALAPALSHPMGEGARRAGEGACHQIIALVDAVAYTGSLRFHPRERIRWLEAQAAAARAVGHKQAEGTALGNLGLAYAALGDARQAIGFHEQQLAIVREIGDRRGEGAALGNLGNAYADLGDARQAIGFYEQQLTIVREIGDRRGEGNALYNSALALDSLGQRAKAIPLAEAALKIYEQVESPTAAKVRAWLAQWRGQ